jgi:hypothetical protein
MELENGKVTLYGVLADLKSRMAILRSGVPQTPFEAARYVGEMDELDFAIKQLEALATRGEAMFDAAYVEWGERCQDAVEITLDEFLGECPKGERS